MSYQPFKAPGQLPVKPTINPLVKQQASGPIPIGPTSGTTAPTRMMPSNPAAAILTRGNEGTFDGRPPGGIPTQAGPTAADIHKQTSGERLEEDIGKGYEMADKYGIGKEGSMGRLNDERKAEIDELLAKQKAGMDGMTPQEMQAAREQGVSGINGQLSTNMSMLGDIAAGNGVRGGSAVGLQMGAMQQAQQQSGSLARQLILDNIAQKNIAMDRYGNTLQTQQGVGLGIQDSNNQSANAEKLARELAAGNYSSQYDSYRAGDKADDFTQQGLDISKSAVDMFGKTGGYGGKGGSGSGVNAINDADTHKVTELEASSKAYDDARAKAEREGYDGQQMGGTDIYIDNLDEKARVKERIELKYPGESEAKKKQLYDEEVKRRNLDTKGGSGGGTPQEIQDQMPNGGRGYDVNGNPKIICTEAFRQGLISEEKWLVTGRYRALLTMTEYKGYLTWATPVVKRMKASPEFAKAIAPFIRRMIEGERYALGEIDSLTLGERTVAALVKVANYTGALVRSLRLKVKAFQAQPINA